MKLIKWILSNKILCAVPLLLLICVAVYGTASDRNADAQITAVSAQVLQGSTVADARNPGDVTGLVVEASNDATIKPEFSENTVKAILSVEGMSCSGCISTIKSSLSGFTGIQDVIVNISAGITEVYYNSQQMKDANLLASAISESGYPATVRQLVSAGQLREEDAIASQRAKLYVASVGGWDISRTEFETEVAYAKNRYIKAYGKEVFSDERGQNVLDNIRAQVVSRLINEGIQMQEVQRVGYRIDAETLVQEFDSFIKQKNISLERFKTALSENGYPYDYFMKKFENRVLLRRYIEENVIQMSASEYDRQQQYLAWFNNAKALSTVVIYDKKLERQSQEQSAGGCGSTCKT